MAKANKAKKQAAKKKDTGIEELLELLRKRPSLVAVLVRDPAKVRRLLKTRAARQLIPTVKLNLFVEAEGYDKPSPTPALYNPPRCLKRSA